MSNCVSLCFEINAMIGFLGEYEISLDPKGRFLVPSAFRKQLPEGEIDQFVINRGAGEFLNLYTIKEWDKITDKLVKLNDFNPKVQLLKRLMLDGATLVEPDSANRILLPKAMQQFASLSKNLIFSAKINKVEIWDQDKYYRHIEEHKMDLSSLSGDIFGNDFLDPFQ